MVMPNGTVYSEAAVRRVSSDTGMFTCPRSGTLLCLQHRVEFLGGQVMMYLILLRVKLVRQPRAVHAAIAGLVTKRCSSCSQLTMRVCLQVYHVMWEPFNERTSCDSPVQQPFVSRLRSCSFGTGAVMELEGLPCTFSFVGL